MASLPPGWEIRQARFIFAETESMFFVMVEISNYRQLARLRLEEAQEIRGFLEHFCQNRGGKLAREQNGFFLFSFHPLREKALNQVSDFLFLTAESLQRKREALFGFSLLLEQDERSDESAVFNHLKTLVFLAPRENRIWAGPNVLGSLSALFPVSAEAPLAEILGPPTKADLAPLPIELLLEMTGWVEALKTPLSRQLAEADRRPGKILRLKGAHLWEKYFVLGTVLHQLYGAHEDFPVLFPVEGSRDFLSQLLARVDLAFLDGGEAPLEPMGDFLLRSRGGAEYPGDSGREDVVGALTSYFRRIILHLEGKGLPAIFVFLLPEGFAPEAQAVLEAILGDLVTRAGLHLLLLEPLEKTAEFLGRHASLSWQYPPLVLERIAKERDQREWQVRFPHLSKEILDACEGRGMAWVHHLWSLQENGESGSLGGDPSWELLQSLDSSHHKVYFVVWAARGLLLESQYVDFFQQWGDDPLVIQDKVQSLKTLGFLLEGLSKPLRPEFGPRLAAKLGQQGNEILTSLGWFLYRAWARDHRLSEVLFQALRDWGLHEPSLDVLGYYLTNKVNQGQGDFLPLLRRALWEGAPTEELRDKFRLLAASAKLRYALNFRGKPWNANSIGPFRRSFTKQTESQTDGEWQLQQGRFQLRAGDLATGFSLLKKALLEAQAKDDRPLEVRAETEIGLALLRKSRIDEGREYFDIASRLAEKTGSSYLTALTAGLDAVALFLSGHLTGVHQAIEKGWASCERGGLQQGKIQLAFLAARAEFDQGQYELASSSLEKALAVVDRYHLIAAESVLLAWKGRAEAYAGHESQARSLLEPLPPSAERSYFLAELAFFSKDLEAARTEIQTASNLLLPTQPFGSGEKVDWTTGFAGVEDRALAASGDVGVLANQIQAFEALLHGLLVDASEAAARFQIILARKFLLEVDPASAAIYYWYYMILPQQDANQEAQRLTLLGRSLKDVQVRASRIEDPAQRQEYRSRPLWNARFLSEAKKFKLL